VDGAGVTARVRPAARADLDRLAAIEEAAFIADRASRRALLHAITSATIDCLVVEEGGEVIGYASLERRRNGRAAHLASLAVAPSAAGRGLGRTLLAAVEASARTGGFERLRLEVRADNEPARRLYETTGYAPLTTIDDYYEDGATAWRYEKRLTALSP
jgi:ribosomal-protein-alanine N-acetyltransferase